MDKLADIGEIGIIEIIKKATTSSKLSIDKLTDDVAILDLGNKYLLFKIDASFENYDFPPFAKPEEIAQTALAIAISDFAAKGARPLAIVTSLELPKEMKVKQFRRLSKALDYFARRYGAEIVGGDVSESDRLAITPAVIGFTDKDKIMMRRGARDGDIVAIVDYLGDYVAGYIALRNKLSLTETSKAYLKKKVT
jgi:thiamine-monophosphate kinase